MAIKRSYTLSGACEDNALHPIPLVSEIMAPRTVFEQGDFTITYVRFNGIFNTLYASGPMIDVSIDSCKEEMHG